MRRPLISPENSILRNAAGCAVAAILVPVAIIVKLLILPFERPIQRSAPEVAAYLRDFIDGTGGDWDWDDFTSIPIADSALEAIRREASEFDDLATPEAAEVLERLYAEAQRLANAGS
jgi:hypothetical protein